MVVIIPSYNNEQWCRKNIESVFSQKYTQYRVIYIDDCSTDNTNSLVKELIDIHKQQHRVILVNNKTRQGAMANWYHAVHSCHDDEIIVNLDGDDWFAHPYVLERLNKEYADEQVWMTYGQFKYYPAQKIGYGHAVPQEIVDNNMYRWYPVVPTHLRTFYAWLFKKIDKNDFMLDGQFFPATCDQAMMHPMLEMAGNRAHFISEVLYIYNQANSINDGKVRMQTVLACEKIIRSKKPYDRLSI